MTKTSSACFRLLAAALIMCGAMVTSSLRAQETAPPAPSASNNPAVATNGATLIHGNYCGAGNRPGAPPIDALDLACMNHDACTPTGGVPTCDCNARLRDEAAAVSQDPRQAPELRSLAALTSAAATAMLCKPMLNAATPPPAVAPAPTPPAPVAQAPVPPAPVATAPVASATGETVPAVSAPMSIVPPSAAEPAAEDAQAAAVPRPRSLP